VKTLCHTNSPLKLYFSESSLHERQCRFYAVPQVFCDLCALFVSFAVKIKHDFNGESVSEMKTLPEHKADRAGEELLAARGLSKTYRGASVPALRCFDISVKSGEIFGLLGPNGAGKTTAISLMSSLAVPDSGTVSVCGLDMSRDPCMVRKLIGLVPQDIALYPTLSARENLMYFGRLHGFSGQHLRESVQESLEMTGLTDRADARICTCSGGMKRRANLAAGILHRPKLIFLDEPTVGIDAQSRSMILEKLLLLREKGTGMIYTTHYMEEAEQICTRVAIMDEGNIITMGKPQELILRHPECRSLGEVFLALTGKQLRD